MSNNKVLNFLEGYNPNLITAKKSKGNKNNLEGHYDLMLKKNNKNVSGLGFSILRDNNNNLFLSIDFGSTLSNYSGRGYGTLLRALATKAGQIAGAKYGEHQGVNYANRSLKRHIADPTAKFTPTATVIVTEGLGWKIRNGSEPGLNNEGRVKSVWSNFNYTKNNISKVNRYLEKSRVRSPGCTRCSIQ
jgi:hypothetical protein